MRLTRAARRSVWVAGAHAPSGKRTRSSAAAAGRSSCASCMSCDVPHMRLLPTLSARVPSARDSRLEGRSTRCRAGAGAGRVLKKLSIVVCARSLCITVMSRASVVFPSPPLPARPRCGAPAPVSPSDPHLGVRKIATRPTPRAGLPIASAACLLAVCAFRLPIDRRSAMAGRSDEMTARESQLHALYDSGRCACAGFPHPLRQTPALMLLWWTLTFTASLLSACSAYSTQPRVRCVRMMGCPHPHREQTQPPADPRHCGPRCKVDAACAMYFTHPFQCVACGLVETAGTTQGNRPGFTSHNGGCVLQAHVETGPRAYRHARVQQPKVRVPSILKRRMMMMYQTQEGW